MKSEMALFGPDVNLAKYAEKHTGKKMVPIPPVGFCPAHKLFSGGEVLRVKRMHPDAVLMAHPGCNPDVCEVAEFVGSTSKMLKETLTSKANKFIIATEVGYLYRLEKNRKTLRSYQHIKMPCV